MKLVTDISGDEAWRKFRSGEPLNAHSHLIAFVLGTSGPLLYFSFTSPREKEQEREATDYNSNDEHDTSFVRDCHPLLSLYFTTALLPTLGSKDRRFEQQ